MSKIAYDPVKDRFASFIKRSRGLRTIFYKLLDLFFLRSWHIRRLLRHYARSFDRQGRWKLLDAGSGFGQYDRFILKNFDHVEVTALDVKQDYLEDCRRYFEEDIDEGRISFHQEDLLELELEPTYQFAICIDVLEHIEEDVKVIENVRKGLTEGGYFLMHSPSHYSEEDAGEDEFFVEEHARAGYSKEDITRKLKEAGLEPIDVHYTYGKLGWFSWWLLIKNPMLWFTKMGMWAAPLVALYYIPMLPIGLPLMAADLYTKNEKGNGVYALARK